MSRNRNKDTSISSLEQLNRMLFVLALLTPISPEATSEQARPTNSNVVSIYNGRNGMLFCIEKENVGYMLPRIEGIETNMTLAHIHAAMENSGMKTPCLEVKAECFDPLTKATFAGPDNKPFKGATKMSFVKCMELTHRSQKASKEQQEKQEKSHGKHSDLRR